MKKTFCMIMLALSVFAVAFAGGSRAVSEKPQIIATTFPIYDWTREILGDRINDVELKLLVDTGVDLHSYQPTIQDVAEISTTDMFIYIGGVSDSWVDDVLAQKQNDDMIVVNLVQILGSDVLAEEFIEGMTKSSHAGHDHDD
ncbi:MAG: zinc ABC transporter substrate-binding protein, partial [Spirochaetales bacterium]